MIMELAMQGHHVSLVQSGDGDSALSWVHDKNNINQRWYAGIDASDGYAETSTSRTNISIQLRRLG